MIEANSRRDLGDGSGRTALVDGSVVGGYRLTYLASGGQSVVYKGEKLGKIVVLKEVETSNTREVPALLSEKSLLERLNHPGLINYHSFLCEKGFYYLVVEYVAGKPLSHLLEQNQQQAVDDVAEWGVQLCDIFEYLHQQQPPIIYRDLKPDNVMLVNGKVKLIDFGIARLHKGGDKQKDTELMGSRLTASPEHYGGSETDARSDIYTLGATIYELLTGGKRKQVGAFAFAPVRELRPEVPAALEAALARSLEFKPADRFGSAREFGDAILQAMGKPPRPAGLSGTRTEPVASPAPRKRGRFAVTVLALLLLAAALGVATTQINFGPGPSEYPPSTGVQEASLRGELFGAGQTSAGPVVFMGEDVGLFAVTAWEKESALDRAKTLAERLNRFYKTGCLQCGGSNLEPADIRVGRYKDSGEVVVFYAHIHGDAPPLHGPMLLATVDAEQAKSMGKPARLVAYYWRDIVRDILSLSRGFPVQDSALGLELADALQKARGQLRPEASSVDNLREILRQTTGKQALAFQELFLKVPERQPTLDSFAKVEGYEPLRD
jgi:tRNA A-37 threonylcarbamoyl transferase component Bud32